MSIRWGVLGTADIAKGCTIPGMLQADNCELYAIAGRNEAKAESFKTEFGFKKAYVGYDALLADSEVKAVYIPLPNSLHCEWVIKALKAGKHVLCEKPMALSVDEARLMYKTAEENNVILMEAFAYLHSPYVQSLKDDIASGIIGDIFYIDTAFVTQGYEEDIRIHKELGGGAIYDLGCYCTTMILSLVDREPTLVKACAQFNENGVDTFSSGIMAFENGIRASWNVGMVLGKGTNGRMDRLYIHGTKGIIRSDVEYNQSGELTYTIESQGKITTRKVLARQNYALEVEQLGRCIENGEDPHVSAEFSLRNAKVIDRILTDIGYK